MASETQVIDDQALALAEPQNCPRSRTHFKIGSRKSKLAMVQTELYVYLVNRNMKQITNKRINISFSANANAALPSK